MKQCFIIYSFCCFQIICLVITSQQVIVQDQTSSRPNTLSDDADDIQKQLDNEARHRFNLHPKTIWIFNFPSKFPGFHGKNFTERYRRRSVRCKSYKKKKAQETVKQSKWCVKYPSCGGSSQSPVSLPRHGFRRVKETRRLKFINFNALPESLVVENNGKTLTLYGSWKKAEWPLLRGGAANNRAYLFHSLTLHWPSEHVIEDMNSPLESQVLYRSADYKNFADAIAASSKDQLALLAVSTLYEFSNHTHRGIDELIRATHLRGISNVTLEPQALRYFSPPFQEYMSYQGSLTAPPCAEAVLWLIRARSLPVERDFLGYIDVLKRNVEEMRWSIRVPQPLNDRRLCYFSLI